MSRTLLLTFALGMLALASGCCGGPCGRGLAFNNYSPVYPTAYSPSYSTAYYGAPVQSACNSCGTGF